MIDDQFFITFIRCYSIKYLNEINLTSFGCVRTFVERRIIKIDVLGCHLMMTDVDLMSDYGD